MAVEVEEIRVIDSDIPAHWERATFRQLLKDGSLELVQDGNHGGAYPKPEEFESSGIPIITSADLDAGAIDLRGCKFLKPASAERLRIGFAKQGDVLLTHKGTIGKTAVVPPLSWPYIIINPQLTLYRVSREGRLNGRYLKFFFDSKPFQAFLERISGISTISTLSLTVQKSLEIPLPPLGEQKAIAAVLGALDDKIELNRRMNATLEAMARALFQSWFVDFDPVRDKLDGRQSTGLDKATGALFPAAFQDSTLGPIPKGWTATRLPEAIEVNPRRTLKTGTVAPYLDMKNLPTQGHSAEEVIDREFTSGTKFQNGDTLLARITPCLENGKTGYVDFLEDGQVGWGSTEYIVFAPKAPLPPHFGYLLARSDALRSHAIQNMTGTSGRQRVPCECFNNFWLAVPPPKIARRFDELTAPMMGEIKANADQSRTLAALRDTILPKLMSGDLTPAVTLPNVLCLRQHQP